VLKPAFTETQFARPSKTVYALKPVLYCPRTNIISAALRWMLQHLGLQLLGFIICRKWKKCMCCNN